MQAETCDEGAIETMFGQLDDMHQCSVNTRVSTTRRACHPKKHETSLGTSCNIGVLARMIARLFACWLASETTWVGEGSHLLAVTFLAISLIGEVACALYINMRELDGGSKLKWRSHTMMSLQ